MKKKEIKDYWVEVYWDSPDSENFRLDAADVAEGKLIWEDFKKTFYYKWLDEISDKMGLPLYLAIGVLTDSIEEIDPLAPPRGLMGWGAI